MPSGRQQLVEATLRVAVEVVLVRTVLAVAWSGSRCYKRLARIVSGTRLCLVLGVEHDEADVDHAAPSDDDHAAVAPSELMVIASIEERSSSSGFRVRVFFAGAAGEAACGARRQRFYAERFARPTLQEAALSGQLTPPAAAGFDAIGVTRHGHWRRQGLQNDYPPR
jgi:hypothetical protein